MTEIPRDDTPDATLALMREGYRYIGSRCERYGSDLFQTRLLGEKAVCMRGAEAARIFYDGERFTRRGAMPKTVLKLLQDEGSVQQLDGAAHRHRKRLFMDLMSAERIAGLTALFEQLWRARLPAWERAGRVVLFDEVRELLFRAACHWCDVPLQEEEVERRSGQFIAMIEGSGSVGPQHWRARLRRARAERWIRQVIQRARSHEREPRAGSPLEAIVWHRDLEGQLLDVPVAAVELINLLRPIVAVGRFITFSALALHRHPQWREQLEDEAGLEAFVQEVRRHTPFFPFIAGRVRQPFDWQGHHFEQGLRVILDLYGTDHHPRHWPHPQAFHPERFLGWQGDPYTLIPQGGGDPASGHRCPGEWITIALMGRALQLLGTAMSYRVPEQDLSVDLGRMPARPHSGFVMTDVRALQPPPPPLLRPGRHAPGASPRP